MPNASYYKANKAQLQAKERARYAANPYRAKAAQIKRKYGLSWVEYAALFDKYGRKCAICDSDGGGRSLVVDHDHSTKEIRGILCHWCNTALGNMRDSPERLRRAAKYLDARQPRLRLADKPACM